MYNCFKTTEDAQWMAKIWDEVFKFEITEFLIVTQIYYFTEEVIEIVKKAETSKNKVN